MQITQRPSPIKVFIHPGHGGNDPGAVGNGMRESDINLDVSLRLEAMLQSQGLEVRMSRRTDTRISNLNIISSTNSWGADCYMDIHCNAFSLDSANGYETFAPAQHAAFRDIIHAAYLRNITIRDRGAKVDTQLPSGARERLRGVNCPSCFPELAFITANPTIFTDVPILRNQRQEMAQALANGIFDFFNIVPQNSIDEVEEMRFNSIDEVPGWAQPTIQKLINLGHLQGDERGLDLSLDMIRMLVINDRAGLYD